MPRFTVTVRHGRGAYRYHIFDVEAAQVSGAMEAAARELPGEIRDAADLVEIRRAPDPEERSFLGDEQG